MAHRTKYWYVTSYKIYKSYVTHFALWSIFNDVQGKMITNSTNRDNCGVIRCATIDLYQQ
jgi:hypothetical protein